LHSHLFVYILLLAVVFLNSYTCVSQDSLTNKKTIEGRVYLETYYSYDFNKPVNHEKAAFLYNHNRHNEFNVNLALASLHYNGSGTRASLGIMTGTYAQYNLAGEPQVLQHVYEANAGLKLSAKKNWWLDVGILPSHIGFESAVSKDCRTLTRSILAENSPYYETGARLSYTTDNENWYIAALMLNGWQRIKRVEGNNTPAFGTQITYTPSENFSINSSTFIGNDKPDSVKQWRYFHNFYTLWQMSKNIGLTLGLDYGWEQKRKGSAEYNTWYSPVAILHYETIKWAFAARAEYYKDKAGVIVPLVQAQPFQMQGYSLNVDRKIGSAAIWRVEWRLLKSRYPYFEKGNRFGLTNQFLTTSVAIDFANFL
jgi:hypothetical protein